MELVFATGNRHKMDELRSLLDARFTLLSLHDAGCYDDIPETELTLEGNARLKACYVLRRCGKACFADDTGLEVAALNGRPGVFSARYAGPECDAAANVRKLLAEMDGIDNRAARFRTVICLLVNGEEHLFEGIVNGYITREPHGDSGFGYDPVFQPEGGNLTFAQMDMAAKNAVSHRGRAVRQLVHWLQQSNF
ncbi:MAG: RdgB/HAM1 family non-canonical purine NTP pyrophosphatase [Bacteroidales bacterium]|jgi:XTP/dITP diphosphohydrolase|nr:RdgB/HAM1 family non-canonical purine NTP pyrophosphatase [Bacteroidales bacterium]